MKRTIAGILFLVALGAGTMFAEDGYGRDRRDIRRDQVKNAMTAGNYAAISTTETMLRRVMRGAKYAASTGI